MYKVYQVQGTDTLNSIAQKVGISVMELMNLNSISDVTPGQFLVVPNQDNIFEIYIVQKNDNLYEIARKNNIKLEDLLTLNGLDKEQYIYPGQEILIPKEDYLVYITKEETLSEVADKLGKSQTDIIKQNENLYLLPEQLIIYRQ